MEFAILRCGYYAWKSRLDLQAVSYEDREEFVDRRGALLLGREEELLSM